MPCSSRIVDSFRNYGEFVLLRIMITGANGHLGRRLIGVLGAKHEVVAAVRSERSAETLKGEPCEVCIVDYTDAEAIGQAADGSDVLINLVGIIKQTKQNRYQDAHENPCQAIAEAAQQCGIKRIISLSIFGADQNSTNACLVSRARADDSLMAGDVPALILRVPMVLGEGDYASRALLSNARKKICFTFRATSLEQPLYAGDLVRIVENLLVSDKAGVLEIGGDKSLPRRELILKMANILGTSPIVISLPIIIGRMMAWCLELLPSPPVTLDMINLLDHDDLIANADTDIELTSLDDVLRKLAA